MNQCKCSFTYLIFVLNCIIGSDEKFARLLDTASHFPTFSTSPGWQQSFDAALRPTFIQKLCHKLPSIVTFTLIQTFDPNFVFFTERRHVDRRCDASFSTFSLFSVSGLKDEKLIKEQTYAKTEAYTLFQIILNISAKGHYNRSS